MNHGHILNEVMVDAIVIIVLLLLRWFVGSLIVVSFLVAMYSVAVMKSFSQNRILGGAAVLALLQFGASLSGLIRDRILAKTFPELGVVDVYIAAFRPSDLLFQMCIMAAFSVALVPLLAQYKAKDQQEDMSDLLSGTITCAAVVFGAIALCSGLLFDHIAPYVTQFTGESLDRYIAFGRIALLTNFLFVFGNAFGQYLITIQRYWIYGLTPILYTVGTICGTVFLTPSLGAFGPIMGTLIGAVVYVFLRCIAVYRAGYRPHLRFWHPALSEMLCLMLPRMVALGILQLELLLFDNVASGLEPGSVTINAYARNFQSVAVGIAGIALAQSAFSLLSQSAAEKSAQRFWRYVRKGVTMMLLLTIPGAIALVVLTPVAATLVHLSHVLPVFSGCIVLYAVSIPFESVNHLLLRSFYALKHTKTPAVFSVINGTVAIAAAWMLAPRFGVYSIAIAFGIGQIIQLIGLSIFLPRCVRNVIS